MNKLTKILMCALMGLSCAQISAQESNEPIDDVSNEVVETKELEDLENEVIIEEDKPASTETPISTEVPVESEVPKETEVPTITETPVITDAPVKSEEPVSSDVPMQTQATDQLKVEGEESFEVMNQSNKDDLIMQEELDRNLPTLNLAIHEEINEGQDADVVVPTAPEILKDDIYQGRVFRITLQFNVALSEDAKSRLQADGWTVSETASNTHNATQTFDKNTTIAYDGLLAADGQVIPGFSYVLTGIDQVLAITTIYYKDGDNVIAEYTYETDLSSIPFDVVAEHLPANYFLAEVKDAYDCIVDETNDQLIATKQHVDIELTSKASLIESNLLVEYSKVGDSANIYLDFNVRLDDASVERLKAMGFTVELTDNGGIFNDGTTKATILNATSRIDLMISGLNSNQGFAVPDVHVIADAFTKATIRVDGLSDEYTVNDCAEFTVSTSQQNLDNRLVKVKIDRNGASQDDVKLEYLESKDGKWYELKGDYFGPESGFPFINGTSKLRATFKKGDTNGYMFDLSVVDANDESIVYATTTAGAIKVNDGMASLDIELDKEGPYKVGDSVVMEVTTHASGAFRDIMVKGVLSSNFDSSKVFAEYEENGVWKELKGDKFGTDAGFPLMDGLTVRFRYTFKEAGNYEAKINLVDINNPDNVVASNGLTALVEEKDTPNPNPEHKDENDGHKDSKVQATWDDGGPFTTTAEGDIYDRWGNLIYDAPSVGKEDTKNYSLVNTSDK